MKIINKSGNYRLSNNKVTRDWAARQESDSKHN